MRRFAELTAATLNRLSLDPFTVGLLAVVALASFAPVSGDAAHVLGKVTAFAIGLLFFLHGARMSRQALVAGLAHWRLQLLVLGTTFVIFPLIGLAMKPLALTLLTPDLYLGILFLCALPSTMQASIAFTAVARGNVAAAMCSASASNLLGIFVTPALVGLLVLHGGSAGSSSGSIVAIVEQLLLPFLAGQLLQPVIGGWIGRMKPMLRIVDQGSILLVVYGAFSESVTQGLWHQVSTAKLLALGAITGLMLALAVAIGSFASRRLGFSKEDEIAVVFCGSKKSLANGVPMAKVLFAPGALGMIILPVMIFHQIQLMACAVLAQRWARRDG
jgi:sodium/bile acid cotransporter 7